MLGMVGLDSTSTHVAPPVENACGHSSSELPRLGLKVMVWELLFGVAEGDGLLLFPSSSGCVPPSTSRSLSLVSYHYGPSQTPGDLPACFSSCVMEVLLSWVGVPQE